MNYFLLVLASAATLSACSGDATDKLAKLDQDTLLHNDFESIVGWVPDATTISKEQAHSGSFSLKVDPAHPYSLTYYSLLGQLSPSRIRGVRVDAWAYTPAPSASANVRLSIGLNDAPGGKLLMGEGIAYGTQVRDAGKWVKISKEVIFPPGVNYSSQLVIYLWNGGSPGVGSGPAYLDDLQLTALH